MRVPFSWLKEFVKVSIPPDELAEKLSLAGIAVERVEHLSKGVSGVVAGKIQKIERHPNADRLLLTRVACGDELLQVITGAQNVHEGDLVPVAPPGATLAGGKVIAAVELRGLPSHGMLCSAKELGFELDLLPQEQRDGVLVLSPEFSPGMDLSVILGLSDSVFVLEVFANRPDLLSIIGVAREVAGILGERFSLTVPEFPEGDERIEEAVSVEVKDFSLCPRYTARAFESVRVRPSPLPMALRLQAAGIRPVNNVVDTTNYVMLEYGQPLHAFDLDRMKGKKVVVRRGIEGEEIVAIDGATYPIDDRTLVIADAEVPIAIAGVMGGKETEISQETKAVLLESATFDASTVRRASLRLGLRSESSRRFEKSLDPHLASLASHRAATLLVSGGAMARKGIIDLYERLPGQRKIQLRPRRINFLLGTSIPHEKIKGVLELLHFETDGKLEDLGWEITVPTSRRDVTEEIDLIEEVARHYGYGQIQPKLPSGTGTSGKLHPEEEKLRKINEIMERLGGWQVVSCSLGDPSFYHRFLSSSEGEIFPKEVVPVSNPLREDQAALRPSLLPELLDCVRRNLNMKNLNLSIYEIGKVFSPNDGNVRESLHLAFALTGSVPGGGNVHYFHGKGILEALFREISLDLTLLPSTLPFFHPGRRATVLAGGSRIGLLGEIHPDLLDDLDISQAVVAGEILLEPLLTSGKFLKSYLALPRYPAVTRDLAFTVDEQVTAQELREAITQAGKPLLEEVICFDCYKGPQIPEGKKSLAFSLTYRAVDRTLTEEEANRSHQEIMTAVQEKFQASLRT